MVPFFSTTWLITTSLFGIVHTCTYIRTYVRTYVHMYICTYVLHMHVGNIVYCGTLAWQSTRGGQIIDSQCTVPIEMEGQRN